MLHDVTYLDVWEALTILEPPIAEAAARKRSEEDLERVIGAAGNFATDNADAARAAFHAAEFFRIVGAATHNRILMIAQEPLLQLLDASLQRMLDKVPQSRARITAAERRICDAVRDQDVDTARTWMTRHIRDFRKGYELAGIDLEGKVAN